MMRQPARMITLELQLQALCDVEAKRDYFDLIEKLDHNHEHAACMVFGIPMTTLKYTKTRKREVVIARQLCMWYMCNKTNDSLTSIGDRYAGKDHATVIHGKKQIQNYIDTKDKVYYPLIEEFKKITNYDYTPFPKNKRYKEN